MKINTEIPDVLSAPWIKRFFKERFGIPVRVRSGGYLEVWIPSRRDSVKLLYDHRFPDSLGNLCIRTVYNKSERLRDQNWGGNINSHSIAMLPGQWLLVIRGIVGGALEEGSSVHVEVVPDSDTVLSTEDDIRPE